MSSRNQKLDANSLLAALATLPEQLQALKDEVRLINERTANLEFTGRAVYDIQALRQMGMPKNEAYDLMHKYGRKNGKNGRFLITRSALERALTAQEGITMPLTPFKRAS